MTTLNLGILAHVDAGKTTLTERLLFDAGVIPTFGSVDAGTTQTDSLALERRRGITIRAAVAALMIGDVAVNLIDTPGHPDFIAEVDRSLSVLDGVVLVVSAVEGVQAQTVILLRALLRLRVPTLLFLNKIDRPGADPTLVLDQIRRRLTPAVIPMVQVRQAGRRSAAVAAAGTDWEPTVSALLAEHDDELLTRMVADEEPDRLDLIDRLATQTAAGHLHPVFAGSALTGAGVAELAAGITTLLPAAAGDPDAPVSGRVFKVDRGPDGRRRAHLRLFDGTIRVRDRLTTPAGPATITRLTMYAGGGLIPAARVRAGQVAVVSGPRAIRVGDRIGIWSAADAGPMFAPPILQAAVVAADPARQHDLHAALTELADQDPLIDLRQDDERHQLLVSLFGEVQKEVLAATLAADFGIDAVFSDSTTLFREWPSGPGSARRRIGEPDNPFLATLGLTVEPAPPGAGSVVELAVDRNRIPLYVFQSVDAFLTAITGHAHLRLRRGLLGMPVQDCRVTITECDYISPVTRANDFARLTPLVLGDALLAAGTTRCRPIQRFRLDTPVDTRPAVLRLLAHIRAAFEPPAVTGEWCRIDGEMDAESSQRLARLLPGRTRGEGVVEFAFDRFAPSRNAEFRSPEGSAVSNYRNRATGRSSVQPS